MTFKESAAARVGLPSDQGEVGSVFRVEDVIRPLTSDVRGGSALIGFASDEGVRRNFGRVGAAQGPAAIRRMLERLPVHHPVEIFEAGDVACTDGDLSSAQERLADAVATLLDRDMRPVVLGGGHEVAYGSFLGLAKHLSDRLATTRILVINLDAHLDLRLAPVPNSGTPFRQIAEFCSAHGTAFNYLCFGISELSNTTALFDRARQLGVEYRLDEEMRQSESPDLRAGLAQRLIAADKVYLSIDLDVLPAAVAPGVSAPAARGVALEIIEDLIDDVISSGKLALADIAELNPVLDRDDQTARVAARLAYRLLLGHGRRGIVR
ncbi:formimidoylglutamase [Microvirga sp. HBU67558]|uniref:formimidoylglutamase n=1 Tax=Microvirga yunnanensis TaxID=2953740 RepID=UPI001B362BDA|nr:MULTISPECIES: formimidoylglutamase [unclassified Microvirga]MBQ0820301.1 formimidoylglutamase [Microvirga sp. HBU67558]